MTVTDELRRMLDERGVEWRERVWGGKHSVTTFWHARGVRWHYRENRFGELRLHADGLAPEQAIAATLGRGECHLEINTSMTAVVCDRCNYPMPRGTVLTEVRFCPNCGRRIVGPTTNDVDAEVAE